MSYIGVRTVRSSSLVLCIHRESAVQSAMWYVVVSLAVIVLVILATRANLGHARSSRSSREMRDHIRRQSYRNDMEN
jgi:hypothetical protein